MKKINIESNAVQGHLSFLQGIINRMAGNSASCKTWCLTLISAIIVILSIESDPTYIWVASLPLILFLFLDAYYLGLERKFRDSYNEIVNKTHSNSLKQEEVYLIEFKKGAWNTIKSTTASIFSISIYPFYLLLVIMLAIVYFYILRPT